MFYVARADKADEIIAFLSSLHFLLGIFWLLHFGIRRAILSTDWHAYFFYIMQSSQQATHALPTVSPTFPTADFIQAISSRPSFVLAPHYAGLSSSTYSFFFLPLVRRSIRTVYLNLYVLSLSLFEDRQRKYNAPSWKSIAAAYIVDAFDPMFDHVNLMTIKMMMTDD